MIDDHTEGGDAMATAKAEATAQGDNPTMHVKVYSPFKVYYNEVSKSISGQNATGPFDILPRHHNFLTLLSAGELIIKPAQGEHNQRIRISGGLMHVKADKVTVFLDI